MKPRLIKALNSSNVGLFVDQTLKSDRILELHIHSEYELLYVNQGKVKVFIGDHEGELETGDVVMMGSGLPHLVRCNPYAKITSLYFDKSIVLEQVHALSDMSNLDELLNKATLGISFFPSDQEIGKLIQSLKNATGIDRVIDLFKLFKNLLRDKQHCVLSSEGYAHPKVDTYVEDRLKDVNQYIRQNLSSKITLDELASVANMSSPAFCNFFKKKTGKTVFQQLNEIRIGYAKKLIVETEMTIAEIAAACGYPSITFFNRQFKKITKKPPTSFKKSFMTLAV